MELTLENVTKKYRKNIALDEYSYTFKEGIYGLLGPNGAGKSTLMKLITQNIKANQGRILLDNKEITGLKCDYRRLIGYMPQQQEIYPFYSGRDFLAYIGLLKGVDKKELDERIEYYAQKVNLLDVIDKKVGTFSGGMKQRLLIAQAFLGESKIIVFDEPTAGLDPKERIHVRELIHDNSKDRIIIVATHVVQDIEDIADNIIFLKKGRLVKTVSHEEQSKGLEQMYMDIFGE